jgi:RiboL-PSP-HEPN
LSCASYFEAEITEVFITFTKLKAGEQSILMHLIKNKALKRQYHTFFDWDKKNANAFFGLLGEDFLATAKRDVSASKELEKGISDFLELGSLRNQLVHKNFVSFPIEKTPDEIFAQYQSALLFLTWISNALNSA